MCVSSFKVLQAPSVYVVQQVVQVENEKEVGGWAIRNCQGRVVVRNYAFVA
jgi:hypothetical protein